MYYVVHHCVTGEELIVTRFLFLARIVNRFARYHVLESYPRSYYADYKGWII